MHITGSVIYDYLFNGNPRHAFMLMEVIAEGVQLMVRLQGRALAVAKNISKIAYFFQVGYDFPLAFLSFRKVYDHYYNIKTASLSAKLVSQSGTSQPSSVKELKPAEPAPSWWASTYKAVSATYTFVSQHAATTPSGAIKTTTAEKAAPQPETLKPSPKEEPKAAEPPPSWWTSTYKAVVSQRAATTPLVAKETTTAEKAAPQPETLKPSPKEEPKAAEPPPSWWTSTYKAVVSQRRATTPLVAKEPTTAEKAAPQPETLKPSPEQEIKPPAGPVVPWWIDTVRAVSYGSRLVTFSQQHVFEKNPSSLMRIMRCLADLIDHVDALYSFELPKPLLSIHTWSKREISQFSLRISALGLTLTSFVSIYQGFKNSASILTLFFKTVYVGASFVLYTPST
jgi:hypothetical protein